MGNTVLARKQELETFLIIREKSCTKCGHKSKSSYEDRQRAQMDIQTDHVQCIQGHIGISV